MAIAVSCRCGKQFKVKDELAGKSVRCPACKGPLRIGEAPAAARSSAPPKIDEQAALLKFQEAQKKKQMTAEEEAAYKAEHNKLIDSYDQLTGRSAGKADEAKKKGQFAEIKPKRRTIFTKIADAFGMVFGTFVFKYAAITVLLGGGVVGSVFLVRYVATYMAEETNPQMSNEDRAKLLVSQAEEDITMRRWDQAKRRLDEAIRLNSSLALRRDYRNLKTQVERALAASTPAK